MSARVVALASVMMFTVGLGGCRFLKKKQDDAAPATSETVAVPTPPPVASTAAAAVAAPVLEPPTTEDFEEEAFEKISEENFQEELAKLEKEFEEEK
jgi:hypothetical protein